MAARNAAVAAADQWTDPDDGVRYPAGEVHGWLQGHNETVCGLSLSRSQLTRFPHVSWADVQPESGPGTPRACRWSAAAARLVSVPVATTAAGPAPTPAPDGRR